jgi:hypothetical protein
MNFWVFSREDVTNLETGLKHFLEREGPGPKSEFHIPMAAGEWVGEGKKIRVIPTESDWFGMTYREDMETTKKKLMDRANDTNQLKALWEITG